MTDAELDALLTSRLAGGTFDGCFNNGEFDLDVNVHGMGFTLWPDGDSRIDILLERTEGNAARIVRAVKAIGHRVIHTWDMSYRENDFS